MTAPRTPTPPSTTPLVRPRPAGRGRRTVVRVALGVATALAAGLGAVVAAPSIATADAPVTELVVRIDPAATTIAAVNAAHGTTLVAGSSGLAGTYLVRVPAGADPEALAEQIAADPGVTWAIENITLTAPEIDEDRMYAWRMYAWTEGSALPAASAYAPAAINLAGAHAVSQGAGVTVAVVDTGVQADHPALSASLVGGIDLVGFDSDPSEGRNGRDDDADGYVDEGAGHGTHVAGVVHQVAPQARIMAVRVLDDDGSGTIWATAEGMLWAAGHGADVINASLGTHSSADLLKDVVEQVTASGTLVVGAAGNDGRDRRMYPAAADGAVAVASVGRGDVRSAFSNYGRWITVAAPGEDIHSTFAFPAGSYAANSGTSMATPFVAGEAALVLGKRPGASPAQVASVIRSTATRVPGELGGGRIDAAAAVNAA